MVTLQLDRADQALYFSKQNDQNRTSYYAELLTAILISETQQKADVQIF